MSNLLRWGILGTGRIARKFARDLGQSRTGKLVAVGSRTADAAAKFTAEFPATAHASYDALLADPNVEAVYISMPHALHAEWAIRCADAGKHILCEKPLTMNLAEAEKVVEAARRNDVFLMEAFMYRCHPQTARLVELIRNRVVGDVRLIRATFSFRIPRQEPGNGTPDNWRLLDKQIGGGAILDVGGYVASMSRLIAGAVAGKPFVDPLEIAGCGLIGDSTGVDEIAVASLRFPGGILAQLACGIQLQLENNVSIWGTEGSIVIPTPWQPSGMGGFSKLIVFKEGVPEEIVIDSQQPLYAIEADHVAEHLAARQSPAMCWEDTLGNMRVLDAWRAAAGV